MKKILKAILFVIMLLSISKAYAEQDYKYDTELVINNSLIEEGQVYKLYRLIDARDYTICAQWRDFFTKGYGQNLATVSGEFDNVISINNNVDLEEFNKEAVSYIKTKGVNTDYVAGYQEYNKEYNKMEINVERGYYLVESPNGTKIALILVDPIAEINEKNNMKPEVDLLINGQEKNTVSAEIGETIEYTINIKLVEAMKGFNINNYSDDGLLVSNVKINGLASENYTIDYIEPHGFDLTINESYLQSITDEENITITFDGLINTNKESNLKNKLTYSFDGEKQHNLDSYAYTWEKTILTLYKDEEGYNHQVKPVVYTLSRDKEGTELIEFIKLEDGSYKVATEYDTNTVTKLEGPDGYQTIIGLKEGTYFLHQINLPVNYLRINTPIELTVTTKLNSETSLLENVDKTEEILVTLTNVVMPFTGGKGTTYLVIVGIILFTTSLGFMITKLRNINI